MCRCNMQYRGLLTCQLAKSRNKRLALVSVNAKGVFDNIAWRFIIQTVAEYKIPKRILELVAD